MTPKIYCNGHRSNRLRLPDGKAGIVVGVTQDLTNRFSAVDLVRMASEKLGGKGGGGRADMAQAGGQTQQLLMTP